jgi:hypothetical protein
MAEPTLILETIMAGYLVVRIETLAKHHRELRDRVNDALDSEDG